MNVIYEIDKNNLRLTNFTSQKTYQLDELIFYIPKECNNATPFLLIKNSKKDKNILKLSNIHEESSYTAYSVSLDNSISLEEGCMEIALILIANDTLQSRTAIMNLGFDNFQEGQKMTIIQELSNEIQRKYQLIEDMTRMNIDIYQSIKEGVNNQ